VLHAQWCPPQRVPASPLWDGQGESALLGLSCMRCSSGSPRSASSIADCARGLTMIRVAKRTVSATADRAVRRLATASGEHVDVAHQRHGRRFEPETAVAMLRGVRSRVGSFSR